jgi:hypothetical protein
LELVSINPLRADIQARKEEVLMKTIKQMRSHDMRRLMMLNVLALFLCSVISLGCGSGSERPISQSDIPDLIGTWEGPYSASRWVDVIRVQILNDSLDGNISFRSSTPTKEGALPTVPIAFKGKIENGRLVALGGKDFRIDMKLRKDGRELKLVGNYQDQGSGYSGTSTLEKIK